MLGAMRSDKRAVAHHARACSSGGQLLGEVLGTPGLYFFKKQGLKAGFRGSLSPQRTSAQSGGHGDTVLAPPGHAATATTV